MTEPPRRGIAWAGVVNLVGGATGSIIGLLLAAIVGRGLGTDGAGAYFVVVAIFMIGSNVAELGADTGLVRFVSAARATGRDSEVPHLVRIAVVPVAVSGLAIVGAVAAWALTRPDDLGELTPGLAIGGATAVVLSAMIAVMLSVSRGLGDVMAYPLLQNILLPLLRLGAVFAVVVGGGGVAAAVTAWMVPVPVVLAVAAVVALTLTARRSGGLRAGPAAGERRRLRRDFWSFSATRGVSSAVEILLEWIDVIIVGALTSPEAAGIYAVVTRCARVGEVVQQAARIAVGPQISSALARGALVEASQLYGLVTAAMIWLAWPFFIVLAIFGDVVLRAFGPGFDDGAVSLAVLSLAMGLATAAGTVQTILLMGGRSAWQLADKSIALVLNIALNLALVPHWGIEGAAVAWAVTIAVDTGLVVHQVQRLMGVRPNGRQLWVAAGLAAGVVGGLATASRLLFGASVLSLVVTVLVAAIVYLAASWPLRHRLGLSELVSAPST